MLFLMLTLAATAVKRYRSICRQYRLNAYFNMPYYYAKIFSFSRPYLFDDSSVRFNKQPNVTINNFKLREKRSDKAGIFMEHEPLEKRSKVVYEAFDSQVSGSVLGRNDSNISHMSVDESCSSLVDDALITIDTREERPLKKLGLARLKQLQLLLTGEINNLIEPDEKYGKLPKGLKASELI